MMQIDMVDHLMEYIDHLALGGMLTLGALFLLTILVLYHIRTGHRHEPNSKAGADASSESTGTN